MSEQMLLNKLAIERCMFNLSHLCALVHHAGLKDGNAGELRADNFYNIINAMNHDLKTLDSDLQEYDVCCGSPRGDNGGGEPPLKVVKPK